MRVSTSGGGKNCPGQMNLDDLSLDEDEKKPNDSPFVERFYKRAAEMGIPIGDLETKNGVSKGYLSRLKKAEDPEGAISAKVLDKMSRMLKVPVEYFLQADYDELTKKELTVINFLNKLRSDTVKKVIEWERDDISWLNALQGADAEDLCMGELENHCLFNYFSGPEVCAYDSKFYKSANIGPEGSFFHVWLDAQQTNVYITKLMKYNGGDPEKVVYEVYLVPKATEEDKWPIPQGVCNTDLSRGIFFDIVESLYFAAEESGTHIKLDEGVEDILNSFLLENE